MGTKGYVSEDFVSTETAKLLLEKDCPDFGYSCIYDAEGNKLPTQAIVIKWLREIHNVFIYIEPFITTSGLQEYKPYCTKIGGEFMWINPLRKYSNTSSDTYEKACESAIKYCLENLI